MSALPSSGRRVPPPPRTLLPGHHSYRLMRQSRVALLYFGFWPRSWSLRRLLPAPAATGILPTLFLRILPQMPEPIPRRFAECVCLVLPQHSSAFPRDKSGRRPAVPANTIFRGFAFEAAAISLCSGLRDCLIGIERGRASRRWRVSILALSVCKVGSQFPHSHVSRGPPIIPDGRVSQVRFEVLVCRQRAFPNRPELKR
jgi:hypothetical protein